MQRSGKRLGILLGLALGLIWSFVVVWVPGQGPQPFIPINLALIYAFVPGGFLMALMIGWIAARRFFNEVSNDDDPSATQGRAAIDHRALTRTVEQMVLALLIWPFVSTVLGAVTVIVMGLALGVALLLFWVGTHLSSVLRVFGFAASFWPTVLAGLWSLWRLAT